MSSTVFSPRIALIGDAGVGKTSLMTRYCHGKFISRMSTVGIDRDTKKLVIDDDPVEVKIWDTAGQERFRTITQSYYRNVHGVLVTYDISNDESFLGLNKWIQDVKLYAPEEVLMCLVGTKKDLEGTREVTEEQAKQFASSYPNVICVMETSAKEAMNVDLVFETLIRELKGQLKRRSSSYSGWSSPYNQTGRRPTPSTYLCKVGHCCD